MPKRDKKNRYEYSVWPEKTRKGATYYRAQASFGYDENGKLKRISTKGDTEREATNNIIDIIDKYNRDQLLDDSKVTVYDIASKMEKRKYESGEIGSNTYLRNLETLKGLSKISYIPIQKLTEDDLYDFMLSMNNYSDSYIIKLYQMLKRTFSEAIRRRIILPQDNPMNFKRPKSKQPKNKVRGLTLDEENRLINALYQNDVKYKELMLVSLFSGLRIGEVCALRIENIDFKKKRMYVECTTTKDIKGRTIIGEGTKTFAGQRYVPLLPDLEKILLPFVNGKSRGLLFTSEDGKVISEATVRRHFIKTLNSNDIIDTYEKGKIDLHSLRHTFASRCVEAKMDAKVIQEIMGHTDFSITMNVYANVFKELQETEISTLDNYLKATGIGL